MRKTASSPSDVALDRLRSVCFGFPGVEEKLSHGTPSFHVRGRMFVMFADDHHADGRIAVWCKATHDEQRARVGSEPDVFFVPPYVGVRGWVGARLDRPTTDWIDLAILLEQGWTEIAPKRLARDAVSAAPRPRPKPPARRTTDAKLARDALERLTSVCLALSEANCEHESRHATFRVRKKTFAYFLDDHHGDGIVGVCVKVAAGENDALVAANPKRFYSPAYIGARGWVGVRLDVGRVDWRDVAERVDASYRRAAPKRLLEREAPANRKGPNVRRRSA